MSPSPSHLPYIVPPFSLCTSLLSVSVGAQVGRARGPCVLGEAEFFTGATAALGCQAATEVCRARPGGAGVAELPSRPLKPPVHHFSLRGQELCTRRLPTPVWPSPSYQPCSHGCLRVCQGPHRSGIWPTPTKLFDWLGLEVGRDPRADQLAKMEAGEDGLCHLKAPMMVQAKSPPLGSFSVRCVRALSLDLRELADLRRHPVSVHSCVWRSWTGSDSTSSLALPQGRAWQSQWELGGQASPSTLGLVCAKAMPLW